MRRNRGELATPALMVNVQGCRFGIIVIQARLLLMFSSLIEQRGKSA
jgi:hypothetical protein